MHIGSKAWKNLIHDGAKDLGVQIDREKIEQFSIHALELMEWNRKINLTAITDPKAIAVKHFLDSIAPAPMIPRNASLLDIGSGGGFPGIPLKILIPSLSVSMIDASRKKVNFLKHIIRRLELENIGAVHVRAEELAEKPEFQVTFDVIISRALSSMPDFIDLALPLLDKKGVIIAMKGSVSEAMLESNGLSIPKSSTISNKNTPVSMDLKRYSLPILEIERSIVSFRRVRPGQEHGRFGEWIHSG